MEGKQVILIGQCGQEERLDVVEGNKNIMWLRGHSDDDDDLCLGNGFALMNENQIVEALENAFLDNSSEQIDLDNELFKSI